MSTGARGRAVTPLEPAPDLRAGLGGSPGEAGIGCGSPWGQGHRWQTPQKILIGVSSGEVTAFAPRPGPTRQPAGSSAGTPQAKPTG